MSKLTQEQINDFINKELGDWMQNTILLLKDRIRQKKLVMSEELLNSLESQAVDATQDTLGKVSLAFLDYGRHRDMSKLFYSRMPPVEVFEEFILKTGLAKFKYVPGYQKGGVIPSDKVAARRIAWAISKSRIGQSYGKPKKWFNKLFWGQISVLINTMLDGYQDATINTLVNELKK